MKDRNTDQLKKSMLGVLEHRYGALKPHATVCRGLFATVSSKFQSKSGTSN